MEKYQILKPGSSGAAAGVNTNYLERNPEIVVLILAVL